VAENESQWPAQYPGYGLPAADQTPNEEQPTAPQDPASPGPTPPTARYVPPAGIPVPPVAGPPAGYQAPPAGYQGYRVQVPPAGYQVPPAGYQVPPGGYQVPQAGYQIPQGVYQSRMNSSMRAASADRERAVDVLKAGFTEGRLTQDEYNDRMGRAYASRTYGELTALTADLPAGAMPVAWPTSAPVYQPAMPTNSLARASLILGVAEFFSMGLTAIPAVICGHLAKSEMRQTGQRGDGMATAGLVLGYMAIIFWGIVVVLAILGAAISVAGAGGGG
jgi:Domain of unknown function (DUF1707)/Domain of unknown function (DUF4190)